MTQVVTYPNRCGAHMMATDSSGHCGYCGRPAGDPMGKPFTPPLPEFQGSVGGHPLPAFSRTCLWAPLGVRSAWTGELDNRCRGRCRGHGGRGAGRSKLIIDRCKSLLDQADWGPGLASGGRVGMTQVAGVLVLFAKPMEEGPALDDIILGLAAGREVAEVYGVLANDWTEVLSQPAPGGLKAHGIKGRLADGNPMGARVSLRVYEP